MIPWRAVSVLVLFLLPVALFAGFGAWALWQTGMLVWLWWLVPLCWGAAYLLTRWWRNDLAPLPGPQFQAPRYWTPRDEEAWKVVQQQQQAVKAVSPERLTEPHFYLQTALDLALQIARCYHPKAKDPLGSVTVPEILGVAHLALEDLEKWVQQYVPGSHLLTVQNWRHLAQAPGWFRTAGNVTWIVAMLLHPANIGRYLLSKLTVDPATRQVQANLLAWFYVIFVRYVGFYVIEMNSGRMRGGATRYQDAMQKLKESAVWPAADLPQADGSAAAEPVQPLEVTIAVVGQVKAGKSSLINALLGRQQAATDVLPLTETVRRYRLELPSTSDRLVLLDTPGYGGDGATAGQLEEVRIAFRQSDLVLLVMDVTSPARAADLKLIRALADWFGQQARWKPPPVLGVLTHIDGLSPIMQWSPPYDWQQPTTTKEQNIAAAVDYNRQQFGPLLSAVVPVCTAVDQGRIYGVEQWLLPATTAVLEEARACALLRTLHSELDSDRLWTMLGQLRNVGWELLKTYAHRAVKPH